MSRVEYDECIIACQACASACTSCAMDCLKETDVHHLTECIKLNLECAAICKAAVEMMDLESEYAEQICRSCEEICYRCAEECEKHEDMEHCLECAEECRNCADACAKMVSAHVR